MKSSIHKLFPWGAALICFLFFSWILLIYAEPMENISLDLSLMSSRDVVTTEGFDPKGWTVYTQDGDTPTELESQGNGLYRGLQLGQTVYFSRVMEEALDSPTLQIGTAERMFSIFLDDTLIYTDCPELDNRIGHLTLPMNPQYRNDPVTISLPLDYQGKTLTIAQSTPTYSEGSLVFIPASVKLYCGYSYESELIAETYQTTVLAMAAFVVGMILLIAFIVNHDIGTLAIALVAFLWMTYSLTSTSFFYSYSGGLNMDILGATRLLSTLALLIFLTSRAGKHRKILWLLTVLYSASLLVALASRIAFPNTIDHTKLFFSEPFSEWLAWTALCCDLILGTMFWRKENRFYRMFMPAAPLVLAAYWIWNLLTIDHLPLYILTALKSGHISPVYYRFLTPILVVALVIASLEAILTSRDRHIEKQLMQERQELALSSYDNMRRQHEEVMMLRHDMMNHFKALHSISSLDQIASYLDDLIDQNEKIRPVARTGNQMLDIILGSKINAARDAGVKVDITRASAPEQLPLSDADLCSLMMNILDNAITAAASSQTADPFLTLDIHVKNDYLVFVCENSADRKQITAEHQEDGIPYHGLGLKIVRNIVHRYRGMIDTEYGEGYYKVRTGIPLL
ncbi:MAG: GHKL domain-containing protein [Lachnospiraceae bacterium]|nr:GHKL domain-containing protein [Lachnospiraceae bacterium]